MEQPSGFEAAIDAREEDRDVDALCFLRDRRLPLSGVILGLFDQSDDCIKLIDLNGRLQFMNCNGRQAMEVEDFEVLAGQPWDKSWPAASRALITGSVIRAREGTPSRFEAFCPTAKGSPRWWDVSVTPIRDEHGSIAAILASSRDITDRKAKEEALDCIAAEMRHRLRNAYTVGAAVSLALAKDQPQNAAFARDLATRLVGLANIQATLVDVGSASLSDIVQAVVNGLGGLEQAVNIEALPHAQLTEQAARALALVLGELSTNSLKYGALSGRGTVCLSATVTDGRIYLDWHETHEHEASSLDVSMVSGGSGKQLMERMLASVGGTVESIPIEGGYQVLVSLKPA